MDRENVVSPQEEAFDELFELDIRISTFNENCTIELSISDWTSAGLICT